MIGMDPWSSSEERRKGGLPDGSMGLSIPRRVCGNDAGRMETAHYKTPIEGPFRDERGLWLVA